MKVLIHHGEIGLKKGNFPFFEKKLVENIKKSAERNGLKLNSIKRHEKRIVADFEEKEERISEFLRNIFGIKYFSFVTETERDMKKLETEIKKILKKDQIKKIAFKTKRADKNFQKTSVEINKDLGAISNNLGFKVDYSNPEKTIFIEVTSRKILVYTEKIDGLGGLPVGTSGRVLCLLSGGIDSPVAAWLLMKRGCTVDFLHFHTFKDNEEASKTKIVKMAEILNKYQNRSKLGLIPYSEYEIHSQGKFREKYDLVMFKYYMIKLAEKFALENHYDAIVTGDNLGQVASQTIENIKVSSFGIRTPIFRPLLAHDKQEIIDLSLKIGTYNLSIEKYKDCCSILARRPSTKTKSEKFKKILKDFNIDSLIENSVKNIGILNIK